MSENFKSWGKSVVVFLSGLFDGAADIVRPPRHEVHDESTDRERLFLYQPKSERYEEVVPLSGSDPERVLSRSHRLSAVASLVEYLTKRGASGERCVVFVDTGRGATARLDETAKIYEREDVVIPWFADLPETGVQMGYEKMLEWVDRNDPHLFYRQNSQNVPAAEVLREALRQCTAYQKDAVTIRKEGAAFKVEFKSNAGVDDTAKLPTHLVYRARIGTHEYEEMIPLSLEVGSPDGRRVVFELTILDRGEAALNVTARMMADLRKGLGSGWTVLHGAPSA